MNINKLPMPLLIALVALSHLSETVYTAALPQMAGYLKISENLVQATSSIYFIGFSVGISSWGWVSDRIGRKPVMLIGLAIYFLATIGCVYSTNIEMLLFFRFLQATGSSVCSVVSQSMIRDSYVGYELSYVYATMSLALSAVPSVGPLIGGYIVQYLGWKYNFIFLSCYSLSMLMLAVTRLPETNRYIGDQHSSKYSQVLKSILNDKQVMIFAIIVGLYNGILFGFYVEAPFVFIDNLSMNPANYGKIGIALSISLFGGAIIYRRLIARYFKVQNLMLFGIGLSLISMTLLFIASVINVEYNFDKKIAIFCILAPMCLQFIAHSLVVPGCLNLALRDYVKVTGTAGAIFGGLYYCLIGVVHYSITLVHADRILPVATLFLLFSSVALLAYLYLYKTVLQFEKN